MAKTATKQAAMGEPLLYDPATAAHKLGISRQQLYRELAKPDGLRSIAIGKHARRIPASEITRWIEQKMRDSAA